MLGDRLALGESEGDGLGETEGEADGLIDGLIEADPDDRAGRGRWANRWDFRLET